MSTNSSTFLQRVLWADAITSGAMGLLLVVAAGSLEGLLGLSASFLQVAGAILIPFAVFVAFVAPAVTVNPARARLGVWLIVALNAIWTVDSVLVLLLGWVAPTSLGLLFVLAQALAVLAFAAVEYAGLRKLPSASTARA